MTTAAARQLFAELMKKAREGRLTDKERAQLRTASQVIRYEKRRGFTGAVNRPNAGLGAVILRVIARIEHSPGTSVTFYRLRQQKEFARIPRSTFDRAILKLKKEGKIDLLQSSWSPGVRPDMQADDVVDRTAGRSYVSLVRNVRNPRGISRRKARSILHEGQVGGFPLTERQRKFFGARASGYPRRRARSNAGRRRGLLRMGKLVELRYYRDHGKKPGYYKHVFDGSPTVYYDEARNTIIAR
jgi:hypothetical protein